MELRVHNFESEMPADHLHYDGSLGALYKPDSTTFRVWAPTARSLSLFLYESGQGGETLAVHPMERDVRGTWVVRLLGDYHGIYYNYRVTVDGATYEVVDPYAKAVGVNGKRGMVVDLARTNPEGWDTLQKPELVHFTDAIIYELHIRDLSMHMTSGIHHKGKFLGLTEHGTKGPEGVATGLDHLKELGITHLHLLPVFDFYTVDEADQETPQYNWGYDPLNYNVPEGSYATDPFDGTVRIREFKEMVKALNENGIRVVMDVVYNHTFLSAESNLNRLVPGYYYRYDPAGNFSNGSGCGNELASERSMARKLIVDSVVHWATEYKIDGFRFDLMGLHDIETMRAVRRALDAIDPTILVYGEGWTGGLSPLPDHEKAVKVHVGRIPGIAVFNDDLRDGIKGAVFDAPEPGFVNGSAGDAETVKAGIVAATFHPQVGYDRVRYTQHPWAAEPSQSVNYAEAHDNLTLWDKLEATSAHESEEERIKMHKMSLAILLTSQGIPFLQAGMDFLRTKFGDANSYRSPDYVNAIDWERKARYLSVFEYTRGLIRLRKDHPAFRMGSAEAIQKHLRFLGVPHEEMVGFALVDHANGDPWKDVVVLFNADGGAHEVHLPGDEWVVVVDGERAGVERLGEVRGRSVTVPPRTTLVLVQKESFEAA